MFNFLKTDISLTNNPDFALKLFETLSVSTSINLNGKEKK